MAKCAEAGLAEDTAFALLKSAGPLRDAVSGIARRYDISGLEAGIGGAGRDNTTYHKRWDSRAANLVGTFKQQGPNRAITELLDLAEKHAPRSALTRDGNMPLAQVQKLRNQLLKIMQTRYPRVSGHYAIAARGGPGLLRALR